MPTVALGTNLRERERRRRSQSTTITRPPPRAAICATAAAMVDFPSFGREDVKPMTLLGLSIPCKLVANLIEPIDSAKGDKGASTTLQNTLASGATILSSNASVGACLRLNRIGADVFSNGTVAMHGICSSD